MKLLLDTHALIWWLLDVGRLSNEVTTALGSGEHEVMVSAVSAFEVTLKHRLGKLPEVAVLANDFKAVIAAERFIPLPVSLAHAEVAGSMLIPHKDPFDRLLIAQAQVEGALLVSNEELFDRFGVRRLW